uniref:Uncharacterized protein n=1 Tax=Nelumbo nucifera TaxID=4432 RepID=A0A822XKT1_NELNU|nr:TPA_asm: hypothetical protein HUJ06_023667 [Nelumbo nucifera]
MERGTKGRQLHLLKAIRSARLDLSLVTVRRCISSHSSNGFSLLPSARASDRPICHGWLGFEVWTRVMLQAVKVCRAGIEFGVNLGRMTTAFCIWFLEGGVPIRAHVEKFQLAGPGKISFVAVAESSPAKIRLCQVSAGNGMVLSIPRGSIMSHGCFF